METVKQMDSALQRRSKVTRPGAATAAASGGGGASTMIDSDKISLQLFLGMYVHPRAQIPTYNLLHRHSCCHYHHYCYHRMINTVIPIDYVSRDIELVLRQLLLLLTLSLFTNIPPIVVTVIVIRVCLSPKMSRLLVWPYVPPNSFPPPPATTTTTNC